MSKKAKKGRPKKDDAGLKLRIVDAFICANGTDILSQRGIYKRLEEYAQSVFRSNLKAYDFSRDSEVKLVIEQYMQDETEKQINLGLAYEPLDINSLIQKEKPDIKFCLIEREKYFGELYQRAANTIAAHDALVQEKQNIQQKCNILQSEKKALEQKLNMLEDQVLLLNKDNAKYKSIIKKEIEPSQAKAVYENRDTDRIDISFVNTPIHKIANTWSITDELFGEIENN